MCHFSQHAPFPVEALKEPLSQLDSVCLFVASQVIWQDSSDSYREEWICRVWETHISQLKKMTYVWECILYRYMFNAMELIDQRLRDPIGCLLIL